MKKELIYVAPEAEVLSAEVEAGFAGSTGGQVDPEEGEIF